MKWIIVAFLIICSFILTASVLTPPLNEDDTPLLEQAKPFIVVIIFGLVVSAIWVAGASYGMNL